MSCPGVTALVSTVGVWGRGGLEQKTQRRVSWVSIPEGASSPGLLREGKLLPVVPGRGSPRSSIPSQAAQRKLRQASTNVKHWNVQMNRLMHPIAPGGRRPAITPSPAALGHEPSLPPILPSLGSSGGWKDPHLPEKIPQHLGQGEDPAPLFFS